MNENEIALQITLKALELHGLKLWYYEPKEEPQIEKVNAFNVKQIGEFYQAALKSIKGEN